MQSEAGKVTDQQVPKLSFHEKGICRFINEAKDLSFVHVQLHRIYFIKQNTTGKRKNRHTQI